MNKLFTTLILILTLFFISSVSAVDLDDNSSNFLSAYDLKDNNLMKDNLNEFSIENVDVIEYGDNKSLAVFDSNHQIISDGIINISAGDDFLYMTNIDNNGYFILKTDSLKLGNYTFNFHMDDFKDYQKNISIVQANTLIKLDCVNNISVGDFTTLKASIESNNPVKWGNLTFYIDGVENKTFLVNASFNEFIIDLNKLPANQYCLSVNYTDKNQYYKNSFNSFDFTVNKIPTEIYVRDLNTNLKVDENRVIDAEFLTPKNINKMNITYESSNRSVVEVDNYGIVIAKNMGVATVSVQFKGTEIYSQSNMVNLIFNVTKYETSLVALPSFFEFEVGQNNTIEVIFRPIDAGEYTFLTSNESVVTVDNGQIIAVGAGNAVITVKFDGNYKYYSSNDTVDVSVKPINTDLLINSNFENISVGDRFIINLTYFPNNLNVSFKSSNESVAIIDDDGFIIAISNGTVNITVTVGDGIIYEIKSVNVNFNIFKKSSDIFIENNPIILDIGEEKFIHAGIIDGNATSYDVNFIYSSSDENIVAVDFEGKLIAKTNGTAIITVKSLENNKYLSNQVNITVNIRNPTKIEVNDSLVHLVIGEEYCVNATLIPINVGNLTYISNNESVIRIENNTLIAVGEGNATITIFFQGNDFFSSFNKTINLTVSKTINGNATVNITFSNISEGENLTINITLPENATGNITISIGNETYTFDVNKTNITVTIPSLNEGNHTVLISYSGDENYNGLNRNMTINVGKGSPFIIHAPDVVKYYGGNERFRVMLTDKEQNTISNMSVEFEINGKKYNKTTNLNGTATFPLNLNSGTYNITIKVNNKTVTAKVEIKATVNGNDVVKVFRNGTQYVATFFDSQGNYLPEDTQVTFNINGVFYDRNIRSGGIARLNLLLEQGEYIITAYNNVTGERCANTIKIIPLLIENHDIIKYFMNDTQYTVRILGSDANPVDKGEVVTFNINGVFYNRTTNDEGVVKLNINLDPGTYIITAEYGRCRVSNNITVLPVLYADDLIKSVDDDQFVLKLVDNVGNPFYGEKVEFNINGVLYYRYTDSNGLAKLNINLPKGHYIITSRYVSASLSNTIIVTD